MRAIVQPGGRLATDWSATWLQVCPGQQPTGDLTPGFHMGFVVMT